MSSGKGKLWKSSVCFVLVWRDVVLLVYFRHFLPSSQWIHPIEPGLSAGDGPVGIGGVGFNLVLVVNIRKNMPVNVVSPEDLP